MRKAIGMSGLLAAILAAGPACAQTAPRRDSAIVIMPDGTVFTEQSTQIGQMRDLQRQMTGQVQARISRELQGLRAPYGIAEIPVSFPHSDVLAAEFPGRMLIPAQWTQIQVPTEKAAFMGVATAPVSALVREQLKIHRGMGLVVQFVEKGSPAADAGLLQNDILEKLDDQLLVNTPQFTALVRSKKPGEEVTLSLIRAGEHITAKIKLAEKEVPVLEDLGTFQPQFVPIPGPSAVGSGVQMNFGAPPEVQQPWQHGQRKTVSVNSDGTTVRHLVNDQYDITLTTARDNTTALIVKDHAGKELFNGPFTTDAEKQKLSADVVPFVKDLGATEAGIAPAPGAHAAITRMDAHHRITLEQNGTEKRLIVVELPDNKTLYDGSPEADEVNNLPTDVREKIQALKQKIQMK